MGVNMDFGIDYKNVKINVVGFRIQINTCKHVCLYVILFKC